MRNNIFPRETKKFKNKKEIFISKKTRIITRNNVKFFLKYCNTLNYF